MTLPAAARRGLLAWYRGVARDLPWRRTQDPYAIWVSEAMLQQTRVSVALDYYKRWMQRFPSAESLAAAPMDEAMALWSGLGYYARCERLALGVRALVAGDRPVGAEAWRRLPGVGAYTSAALASICDGEAIGVVDGNVRRVVARLLASPAGGAALQRIAQDWMNEHVPADAPAEWNQAVMELGATLCKPRKPDCKACPLARRCLGRRTGDPERFPTAKPRRAETEVRLAVWVPVCGERLGIERMPAGEWWQRLWCFPWRREPGAQAGLRKRLVADRFEPFDTVRHTVSHHRIESVVSLVRIAAECPSLCWLAPDELESVAMPAFQRRIARAYASRR